MTVALKDIFLKDINRHIDGVINRLLKKSALGPV